MSDNLRFLDRLMENSLLLEAWVPQLKKEKGQLSWRCESEFEKRRGKRWFLLWPPLVGRILAQALGSWS